VQRASGCDYGPEGRPSRESDPELRFFPAKVAKYAVAISGGDEARIKFCADCEEEKVMSAPR